MDNSYAEEKANGNGSIHGSKPRLMVAGLSGDSGKTLVSLGLTAAMRKRGVRVAPFKKGPDYIDAAWLSLAAGTDCRNLDTFLMDEESIEASWERGMRDRDLAIIEGNRGLFDGVDTRGSHSSANLARLLGAPVLLVVDVTKMTRTAAALVVGVQRMDPELALLGVVVNRVAGSRHEMVVRESIETETGLPVLGAIPRLNQSRLIPGRHLGLVTTEEFPEARSAIDFAGETACRYLDLDRIQSLARAEATRRLSQGGRVVPLGKGIESRDSNADRETVFKLREKQSDPDGDGERETLSPSGHSIFEPRLRIGIVRDAAFPFYYPENLETLRQQGADLVELSALASEGLPGDLDALYIGGGFPETHAQRLAENHSFLESLRAASLAGLPIYAECGGLMLLAEWIEYEGKRFPMAGVFPVDIAWSRNPAGHGYSVIEADALNPFYPAKTWLRGHEFHHSRVVFRESEPEPVTVFTVHRGFGVGQGREGLSSNNTLGLYTHIHAAGCTAWAEGLLKAAERYRNECHVH